MTDDIYCTEYINDDLILKLFQKPPPLSINQNKMVALPLVRESNSHLSTFSSLSNPVAVFVGATQGIGLSTLQQYASHTRAPKIYIVGRSEPVGVRIVDDLKARNAAGSYVFLQGQVSLLESVDEVCRDVKSREKRLDLLFMSPGFLSFAGRHGEILSLQPPAPDSLLNLLFLQKRQKASTPFSRFATTPAPSSSPVSSLFSITQLARAWYSSSRPAPKAPSFPTILNSSITIVLLTALGSHPR